MKLSILWLLTGLATLSTANAAPFKTKEERMAAWRELNFRYNEIVSLPISGAALWPLPETELLEGNDAKVGFSVLNGIDAPPGIEALLIDPKAGSYVTFRSYKIGYVERRFFHCVKADDLIRDGRKFTYERNAERRGAGVPTLTDMAWHEEPRLDVATPSFRWALKSRTETGENLNVTVIVFSRDGFQRINWVGAPEDFSEERFRSVLNSFILAKDEAYQEFKRGDRVADSSRCSLKN